MDGEKNKGKKSDAIKNIYNLYKKTKAKELECKEEIGEVIKKSDTVNLQFDKNILLSKDALHEVDSLLKLFSHLIENIDDLIKKSEENNPDVALINELKESKEKAFKLQSDFSDFENKTYENLENMFKSVDNINKLSSEIKDIDNLEETFEDKIIGTIGFSNANKKIVKIINKIEKEYDKNIVLSSGFLNERELLLTINNNLIENIDDLIKKSEENNPDVALTNKLKKLKQGAIKYENSIKISKDSFYFNLNSAVKNLKLFKTLFLELKDKFEFKIKDIESTAASVMNEDDFNKFTFVNTTNTEYPEDRLDVFGKVVKNVLSKEKTNNSYKVFDITIHNGKDDSFSSFVPINLKTIVSKATISSLLKKDEQEKQIDERVKNTFNKNKTAYDKVVQKIFDVNIITKIRKIRELGIFNAEENSLDDGKQKQENTKSDYDLLYDKAEKYLKNSDEGKKYLNSILAEDKKAINIGIEDGKGAQGYSSSGNNTSQYDEQARLNLTKSNLQNAGCNQGLLYNEAEEIKHKKSMERLSSIITDNVDITNIGIEDGKGAQGYSSSGNNTSQYDEQARLNLTKSNLQYHIALSNTHAIYSDSKEEQTSVNSMSFVNIPVIKSVSQGSYGGTASPKQGNLTTSEIHLKIQERLKQNPAKTIKTLQKILAEKTIAKNQTQQEGAQQGTLTSQITDDGASRNVLSREGERDERERRQRRNERERQRERERRQRRDERKRETQL